MDQLEQLTLVACVIRGETFEQVQANLADVGVELIEELPTEKYARAVVAVRRPNAATRYARQLHDELNYAKHHPNLWLKWSIQGSDIEEMRGQRVRSIHLLKKATTLEHIPTKYRTERVLAWAPEKFYSEYKSIEHDVPGFTNYKFGDPEAGWSRQKRGGQPLNLIRLGVAGFVEEMYEIGVLLPAALRASHQSFWWGEGKHQHKTTREVRPTSVDYTELDAEHFGGEDCRVFESAGRHERLWVSKKTGRLRGRLGSHNQGYGLPVHRLEVVRKILGRSVSYDEYTNILRAGKLPKDKREQLSVAWNEYSYPSSIPWSLAVYSDYREIAPGRWFPFHVLTTGWSSNKTNKRLWDYHSVESKAIEVLTEGVDLPSRWEKLLPKEGDKGQDQRFRGAAVNFEFEGDRPVDKDRVAPKVSGLIMATLPDRGLAVISLGKDDGLEQGDVLKVIRDKKQFAKLKLRVVGDRSVGEILGDAKKTRLKKGDTVSNQ